jgi:hypothetical protein
MSIKINPILPKQQSTTQSKLIFKPKVADKTKQTNQAVRRLAGKFNGNDEPKPPEKTADTFLKEIIAEQPIIIKDNNAKKEIIVMKADKPADKMTKEDYNMSFRRAVYGKAMVGVKLTDADIKLADQTLKDAKLYDSNYDLNSSVESLREKQRESGNILKVNVGTENLEKAKLAGQAVSRLRTHEAEKFEKNQAGVESETNQKFVDQARVVYNSIVNTIEGTINTGIDLIRLNNGRNPFALVDPFRPRVDFSGIKADYKSEMMRTDINGKLDGNGIKRGDFTEGAVTILAPLVVGKVTTPTRLNQLNLQFPLRNGTAAKIGVVNMQSELDPFIARQVGREISKSPVASRAYAQMQKFGTEVKLDFGKPTKRNLLGEFNYRWDPKKNINRADIFMQNNGNAKNAVATICHESCHARSKMLGRFVGSQFDEFRSFTREFLFTEGRKPSLAERKTIWSNVQRNYWDKSLEKNPFNRGNQK